MNHKSALIKESLTVVRLSQLADSLSNQQLSGVGVIVDRVIGSLTTDEYQSGDFLISSETEIRETKINQIVANTGETEYTPIEIVLSSISTDTWQPQRWQLA
jgi:hypothetical protein